ncbi:MAG: HAD hydrolase family protein [Woeseiaceae bacterium]|nr:HAD hydrolase family protein [Woeseiaceae bacterium]
MSDFANIRLVAFDIDGVFTDGRFYLSDDGVETKAFSTQDGYGIRRALDSGLEIAVISGRASKAVSRRMRELGVQHVFLACKDKVAALEDLARSLGISTDDCAFVGDDVPDLSLLEVVGLPIAVANAVTEVKEACTVTTSARGGHGAVREVCDLIVAAKQ